MALRLSCPLSRRASVGVLSLLALTACGRSDLNVLDTFVKPPSLDVDDPSAAGQGGHPLGGQAGVSGHAGASAGSSPGGHAGSSPGGQAGLGGAGATGGQGGAGAPLGQGGAIGGKGGASGAGASGGMGGGSLVGAGGSLGGVGGGVGGVGGSPTGAGGSPSGAGGVPAGAGGGGTAAGGAGSGGLSGSSGQGGAEQGGAGGAGQGGVGGAGQGGALVQQTTLVSLSDHHACAHLAGGGVKCWGNNNEGQLGLGDTEWRGDQPGEMGDFLPFVDLGTMSQATGVSVLESSSCALFADGRVKCWGNGVYGGKPGQMGDVVPFVRFGTGAQVVQLVSGEFFVCGLLATGQVKCWGDNTNGQLGLGEVLSWSKPAEMGDNLPALDLGTGLTVRSLAAGARHTCALFTNGRVKCWGFNNHGELGLGDVMNRGDDEGEMGDKLPFVDLGSGVQAMAVHAGLMDTCALLSDGRVKCWGFNEDGRLGLGDKNSRGDSAGEMGNALPFIDLGTGSKAVALSLASASRCALLDDSRVKCWGINSAGQLGLGDKNSRGDEPGEMGDFLPFVDLGSTGKVIGLSSGAVVGCALFDSGQLKCWGAGAGLLFPLDSADPFTFIGDEPGEMGDFLPAIDLGAPIGP